MERWIRPIAGSFILLSLLLSRAHSPWLWFTAFAGDDLFQSALTRSCLIEKILWPLGVREQSRGYGAFLREG